MQAFLKALHDLGYDEHRNFAIEFRSAEGSLDRLPELAAELVGLKVDVLIAPVCGAPLTQRGRPRASYQSWWLPAMMTWLGQGL